MKKRNAHRARWTVALGLCGLGLSAVSVLTAEPRPTAPDTVSADVERARRLIQSQSLEEAVSLLRASLARHPEDADAHLLLGTALALLPRRTEALAELHEAVRLRPDFAPGYHALGMALSRFVEPDQARQAFEKALALDPRLAQAHVDLALLLAQAGESDAAARHLEAAIATWGESPAAAYAHYLRGLLFSEKEQPRQAVKEFERAVGLQPSAEAYLQLGLARRRLEQFDASLAALREAVRLAPTDAQARYELGAELLRAGQTEQAIVQLRAVVASRPEDKSALYKLARALRGAGRADEALQVAAKLREVQKRSERTDQQSTRISQLNDQAMALEQSGQIAAAIEKYSAALELDPLNTVLRRNLGLALCRARRWQEGIQELQEVLQLDANDEKATKALYIARERVAGKP